MTWPAMLPETTRRFWSYGRQGKSSARRSYTQFEHNQLASAARRLISIWLIFALSGLWTPLKKNRRGIPPRGTRPFLGTRRYQICRSRDLSRGHFDIRRNITEISPANVYTRMYQGDSDVGGGMRVETLILNLPFARTSEPSPTGNRFFCPSWCYGRYIYPDNRCPGSVREASFLKQYQTHDYVRANVRPTNSIKKGDYVYATFSRLTVLEHTNARTFARTNRSLPGRILSGWHLF